MNFLVAIKLSFDFDQVQICINYKKIILKFFVLSVALARSGTLLPVVREITLVKKHKECIILYSNHECAKGFLDRVYSTLCSLFTIKY